MSDMQCPTCGEDLYLVQGLHFDRDGIRNARWCSGCCTLYGVHASGLSVQARLYSKRSTKTCPMCEGAGKITCPCCKGKKNVVLVKEAP